jgi:hypothetical protein
MMIAEQVYDLVKSLPAQQASMVLAFAEFVCSRYVNPESEIAELFPATEQKNLSFKVSLQRLNNLTQASPAVDPVALIQSGREELDERNWI